MAAIGLALLLFSADFMVRGAVGVARRIGMSPLVIGLTVVAIGTSAPELVTTLTATLEGAPDLALGNVIGSNLANMLLILGVAALMQPVACAPNVIARDGSMVLVATALFVAFAMTGVIELWHGLVLLSALLLYLGWTYRAERTSEEDSLHAREVEDVSGVPERGWVATAFLLGGLIGTVLGAKLLVDGGVAVAESLGVSKTVIGLTLVAIGTSLPELAIVVVASMRGHSDVALGNVLGSNIFNLLGITGVVALVTPLDVPSSLLAFDIWLLLGVTLLLLPMMLTGGRLSRREGALLLLMYAGFLALQSENLRAYVL
ncbi:MAG: calcium/sodium antiporter [Alphaproteobacteria bacterium]|nr:calcium/sodium antiporter [Alphaproteobacteria bacterium]